MLKHITAELKEHIPFTAIGAASGIIIMAVVVIANILPRISEAVFETLHPLHVILSALTTTALYRKYGQKNIVLAVIIGYLGSVGLASISDAIIPFLGGSLLGIEIQLHVPFISTEIFPYINVPVWVVINSAGVIGILAGYFWPTTRLPHMGHVFLSTWASLFYFAAFGVADWLPLLPLIFVFLFLAVWLPCCVSDIVFPLLFTGGKELSPHHR
ncbi:hypothetical protein ACFLUG_00730 [Chloroflexota bacterium]